MSPTVPAGAGFALTAVVPCLDEAESIASTYAEICAELGGYDLELLFVDDGSTDRTLPALRELAAADPRVRYLSFTRNFGFEAAFSAGYRYASRPWVLHLDADLQFPPAAAHALVAAARDGCDAVFGVRGTRHDPWPRRVGAAGYHFVARRLLRIDLPPGATTFRLVRTELARRVVDLRLGTPYFLATLPRLTNRYTCVPVEHRARRHGRSRFGLRRLVGHAVELYVGFSRRLATAAALLALGTGGLAAVAALAVLAGWSSAPAVWVLGLTAQAVGLAALAVLTRYVVLVADAQARPAQYYVREANLDVEAADLLYPDAGRVRR